MAAITHDSRTEEEFRALASALRLTAGAAPSWLHTAMAPPTIPLRRFPNEPGAYRRHMSAALSFGALLVAFLVCVDVIGEVRLAPPKRAARAAAVDTDAREAIALVQDWQLAGDDKPLLQRLAGAVLNPKYPRAWSAEKTEYGSYLVIFREPARTPAYAFEVVLESQAVKATPETVELLTILRLREATESPNSLVARAR